MVKTVLSKHNIKIKDWVFLGRGKMPGNQLFYIPHQGVFMQIRRLFFVLFVAAAVFGCKSPPPPETITVTREVVRTQELPREEPLTPGTLERLKEIDDYAINKYQFVLSGQIILNLVRADRRDRNNSSVAGAIFENIRVRNQITFPDKSLGLAIGDVIEVGDEYQLHVCFENQGEEARYPAASHFLIFHARKSEQSAYFYLEHDAPRSDSEEKGILIYGSETYTLQFNDEDRPYLSMRLERISNTNEGNRTVRGRTISNPK